MFQASKSPFGRQPEQNALGIMGDLASTKSFNDLAIKKASLDAERAHRDRMNRETAFLNGGSYGVRIDDLMGMSKNQRDQEVLNAQMMADRYMQTQRNALQTRYSGAVRDTNDASIRGYEGSAPREQLNAERAMKQDVLSRTLSVLAQLLGPTTGQQSAASNSFLSSLLTPTDTNVDFRAANNQQIGGVVGATRPISSMYRYG